jgi:Tol biopolymer transport system component
MLVVVEVKPAEAAFPGKNGKIAFASYQMLPGGLAPDSVIYTINAGGRGKFQVTHNNTFESTPDYSPDGKKIAYVHGTRGLGPGSTQKHGGEIYTINATGGKLLTSSGIKSFFLGLLQSATS